MVAGILVFYLWITLLHCFFVGMAVHLFQRNGRGSQLVLWLICTILLALIETYWIPVAMQAGASLTVSHPALLETFDLAPQTNIIPMLHPGPWSIPIWLAQGALAHFIGRKAWQQVVRKLQR